VSHGQLALSAYNVVNTELHFFMPSSSIPQLVPVMNGKALLQGDSIELKDHTPRRLVWWAPPGILTHYALGLDNPEDSLFAILTFCEERLIEVTFAARGHYFVSSLYNEADRSIGSTKNQTVSSTPDSTVRHADRIVSYGMRPDHRSMRGEKKGTGYLYQEDCRSATAQLTIYDVKALDRMPGWCGNDRRKVSWEKFVAFVGSR
jgi:hypothetical protein